MQKFILSQNSFADALKKVLKQKIYSIILLTLLLNISLQVGAQDAAITLKMEGATITEALAAIDNKTSYSFLYETDDIYQKKISIDVENEPIGKVLDLIFKDTDISYTFVHKQIVLKRKSQGEERGQTSKIVAGTVTDQNGLPLVGVSIWKKGTTYGVVSDANGKYVINKVTATDTLAFQSLGYEYMEKPAGSNAVLDIQLVEAISGLEAIVVFSSGYEKISEERATGSYELISSKELNEVGTISILERLEGKVAGVNFDSKNNNISIRGKNSFSRSAPLIVIDGFPMPEEDFAFSQTKDFQGAAALSYLNPEDIESITILKDAAASSIWGSRAANGVIVVKTKQGKSSEPTVNFSTSYSIGEKPYLSKLKQMNSAEYIDFEQELKDEGFIFDNINTPITNGSFKNLSEAQDWMFKVDRGTATEAERDAALAELATRDNTSQIKKYLLQNSIAQQYNLSISGGSDNHTYFLSGNYNTDRPVMKGNEAKSYNLTFNNSVKLFNNKIVLSTGINYLNSKYTVNTTARDALSNVASSALRPYDMIVDENGKALDKDLFFNPAIRQDLEDKGYLPWTYNYLDELDYSNIITATNNIRFNAGLNSDITSWLNLEVSGMYYKTHNEQNTLNEVESFTSRNLINEGTSYDETLEKLVYGIPMGGYLNTGNSLSESYDLRGQANINKTFKEVHEIHLLGGAEIRQEKKRSYSQSRYGYDEETNTSQAVSYNDYYMTAYGWEQSLGYNDGTISKYRNRYLSYFTSGTYSYNNKYFLSGSVRLDDYNLLGSKRKDRALPLWSTGVKWGLHTEPFMRQFSWLNLLTPRITYGKAGSSPIGGAGNPYVAVSSAFSDYYTQLPQISILYPANSELKWETTKTVNMGLDFAVFQSRLSGSIEVYYKKSDDILTSLPYNPTYGFSFLTYNTATLSGNGTDIQLTADVIRNSAFKWTSTLTFAYNTNEVTDSRFDASNISQYLGTPLLKGKPLNNLYAYKWAGLDKNGQSLIYDDKGDVIDQNVNDFELNPEVLKYMGTTIAPYFGGFFNTFRYKSFSVGVQITYYMGHVFRKPALSNYPTYTGTYYGAIGKDEDIAKRWKESGDEQNTNVPGIVNISNSSYSRYINSDINVLPADNIRLQQISLSYGLPEKWMGKSWVKDAMFSFDVRNLGVIWVKNKEGYDPNYLATSNYSTLSPSRSYNFRIRITL